MRKLWLVALAPLLLCMQATAEGDGYAFVRAMASAESGDAAAEDTLGQMYLDGNGTKQDFEQAAAWFQKATDQKQPDAALMLGKMYFIGKGVSRDPEKAAKDWTIAAEAGNTSAPALVGRYYFTQGFIPEHKQVVRVPAIKALYWASIGAKVDPSDAAREYSAKIVEVMKEIDSTLQPEVDALTARHKFPD